MVAISMGVSPTGMHTILVASGMRLLAYTGCAQESMWPPCLASHSSLRLTFFSLSATFASLWSRILSWIFSSSAAALCALAIAASSAALLLGGVFGCFLLSSVSAGILWVSGMAPIGRLFRRPSCPSCCGLSRGGPGKRLAAGMGPSPPPIAGPSVLPIFSFGNAAQRPVPGTNMATVVVLLFMLIGMHAK